MYILSTWGRSSKSWTAALPHVIVSLHFLRGKSRPTTDILTVCCFGSWLNVKLSLSSYRLFGKLLWADSKLPGEQPIRTLLYGGTLSQSFYDPLSCDTRHYTWNEVSLVGGNTKKTLSCGGFYDFIIKVSNCMTFSSPQFAAAEIRNSRAQFYKWYDRWCGIPGLHMHIEHLMSPQQTALTLWTLCTAANVVLFLIVHFLSRVSSTFL